MSTNSYIWQEPFRVRESSVLTNSYVSGAVIDSVQFNNQVVLYVSFTKGSLTSLELKAEFSHDGTTYYQETFATITGGTETDVLGEHTMTTSGNYRLAFPIKDKYIKISVKGTGTVTNSLCSIVAPTGIA